jgi:hypothetical protein
MKKLRVLFLLLPAMFVFSGCLKEDHTIRFRNSFSESLNNVVVGQASFGTIKPGETTEYKSIETGSFELTGKTASGQDLIGSGNISGKGKHKWTLVLSAGGHISMSEDKK